MENKNLYQIIKHQKQLDKIIAEGEQTIKADRTYSLEEARKRIHQLDKHSICNFYIGKNRFVLKKITAF